MDPAESERKRERNIHIAAYVGSVILPLAGLIVAGVFYAQEDRQTAGNVLGCALIGIALYLFLFA